MIKQKPISLKLDVQVLGELDDLISAYPECNVNRNKFINYAVRYLLESAKLQVRCCSKVAPRLFYSIESGLM